METYSMGKVVIDAHSFFMGMYANEVTLVSIRDAGNGTRVAKLTGALGCATEAGTASGRVGSREAEEPAFFEIEATDGGHGGGAARDTFVFTVFFDPEQAPLNHGIFGPNPAMITGGGGDGRSGTSRGFDPNSASPIAGEVMARAKAISARLGCRFET